MTSAVIFGGTGFIGAFFAQFLLQDASFDKVYLVDLEAPGDKASDYRRRQLESDARIVFVRADVRQPLDAFVVDEAVGLVANFAAVHREPGHEDHEYYQTNLLGAENVCRWTERAGCERVIFTSSIAPYGPSEASRDEGSVPVPTSAYGGSKLAAEKIHEVWQARDDARRRLVIVRPGVVFGPGEGGNVSRLIAAVLHRYFFYMGNQATRKAGVYVRELCRAMWWVLQRQETSGEHVTLFNMSMNPGPSIREYVESVCRLAGVRRLVPGIPYPVLLTAAYAIDAVARPLGVRHPFSPVRIRKLVRSNNIVPAYLIASGYPFSYSLDDAFADWRKECPQEWR